jgi:hypothetical protein
MPKVTPSITQILSGTPIWVFVLLAYLLWVGASRLKPGVRDLAKVWITPGVFIVWGLFGLFQRPGDFSEVLAASSVSRYSLELSRSSGHARRK